MRKSFLPKTSKLLVALVYAALALVQLTACSYFFGPKPSSPPVQFREEGLSCMDKLGPEVKAWSQGEGGDITLSIECAITALEKFESSTRGQRADSWSQPELENFLATYVASEAPESRSALVSETLRWKHILLGGEPGRISRDEFRRVRALLREIEPSLKALTPHLGILFLREEKAAPEDAEAVVRELDQLAAVIEREMKVSSDLRPTLELSAVVQSAKTLGLADAAFLRYIPLAGALKSVLVGGDDKTVAARDWQAVVREAALLWKLAIRGNYQFRDNEVLLSRDFSYAEAAVSEVLSGLTRAVKAHGEKGIPRKKLELVIDSLGTIAPVAPAVGPSESLLPGGVTAPSLKKALPWTLSKLLYGNSRRDRDDKAEVFGSAQLTVLRGAARDWVVGQRMLNDAMGAGDEATVREVYESLIDGESQLDESSLTSEVTRARSQLVRLLRDGRPLVIDNDRLIVVHRTQEQLVKRSDLERLNLMRAGLGLLLRGYTHDPDSAAWTLGISEAETQEFYLDGRWLGAELGFIDIRNVGAGVRSFMEANIFLSVSDGDSRVSLHEAVEWLTFVMGAGKLADKIYDELDNRCHIDGTVDIFGRRKIDTKCFRREMRANFASYFANLPGMRSWFEARAAKDPNAADDEFIKAVEAAARPLGASDDEPIDSSEMRAIVPIIHYAESVFAARDFDRSGVLESKELWAAYPVIQPFIRKIGGAAASSEILQKAIFSYLVVFGEPPTADWVGGGQLLAWSLARYMVSESASRLDVMKVMAGFGVASRRERISNLNDFYTAEVSNRTEDYRRRLAAGDLQTAKKLAEKFQCLGESVVLDAFRSRVKERADSIVPAKKDPEAFYKNVREMIRSDRRLEFGCLAF